SPTTPWVPSMDPKIPKLRHMRSLGIFRVHDNAPNRTAVLQADVLPGASSISGTINSVPPLCRVTVGGFAGPNPHHIAIARGDRDCANRLHRLFVENCIERHTVI